MSKTTEAPKPPYGSFKTARSFIETLKNTVVPDTVDRSMMGTMSGDSQTETISAFRFLGLLDSNDKVQKPLRALVTAFGSPRWTEQLSETLTTAYAPVIDDLDITTSTARALADRFKAYGVDGYMLPRCVRFYIAALNEAKIKHSPLFKAPTVKRPKVQKPKNSNQQQNDPKMNPPTPPADGNPLVPANYTSMRLPPDDRMFVFPMNINEADVAMINAVLGAYAARSKAEESAAG